MANGNEHEANMFDCGNATVPETSVIAELTLTKYNYGGQPAHWSGVLLEELPMIATSFAHDSN